MNLSFRQGRTARNHFDMTTYTKIVLAAAALLILSGIAWGINASDEANGGFYGWFTAILGGFFGGFALLFAWLKHQEGQKTTDRKWPQ